MSDSEDHPLGHPRQARTTPYCDEDWANAFKILFDKIDGTDIDEHFDLKGNLDVPALLGGISLEDEYDLNAKLDVPALVGGTALEDEYGIEAKMECPAPSDGSALADESVSDIEAKMDCPAFSDGNALANQYVSDIDAKMDCPAFSDGSALADQYVESFKNLNKGSTVYHGNQLLEADYGKELKKLLYGPVFYELDLEAIRAGPALFSCFYDHDDHSDDSITSEQDDHIANSEVCVHKGRKKVLKFRPTVKKHRRQGIVFPIRRARKILNKRYKFHV